MRQAFNYKLILKIVILLALTATFVYANRDRLPPRLTGAFGEDTCHKCHNEFALNSGDGSVEFIGFPDRYVPDREHFPIKIRINHPGAKRWGFQASSRLANGDNSGHFHITDVNNTELFTERGILYINHTRAGTYGGRESPVEWEFEWHSEETVIGPITIYVAAVAADDDDTEMGDYVYTATKTLQPGEKRSQPYWVAAGDFRRNGISDLVRANFESDNLTVQLGGDAKQILGNPVEYDVYRWPYGNRPYMVAVGDFKGDRKGDRKLDLVCANSKTNTISSLFGFGDGTFSSAQRFAVGAEPRAVAVGDFNGDSSDDVATANWGSNDISVLLSIPESLSFAPPVNYPVASKPSFIATGDLNGDGKLDLVVSNEESDQISVLLGNGDGTFGTRTDFPAGGMKPAAMVIGDFNGDKNLDVVVVNHGSNNISFLPGDGSGRLGEPVTTEVGKGPIGIAYGDFDEDGYLDVAVANSESNTLSVMMGLGDGTFTLHQEIGVGEFPRGVAVGDFDGDGILDLVTGNVNSNNVTLLLGDGQGSFAPPPRRTK